MPNKETKEKDPAFLLYSKDMYEGMSLLSFEERGKYLTILLVMHQQGRLTEDDLKALVGGMSPRLLAKFQADESGQFFNVRLEKEIARRAAYVNSRVKNLTIHMGKHKGVHKEKEIKKNKEKKQTDIFDMGDHMKEPYADTIRTNHMDAHSANANAIGNVIENESGNGSFGKSENLLPDFTKPDVDGDVLVFPFPGPDMAALWSKWKEARWIKQNHTRFGPHGEQSALNLLAGRGWPEIRDALEKAIAGGWKNLYVKQKNGTHERRTTTKTNHRGADAIIDGPDNSTPGGF